MKKSLFVLLAIMASCPLALAQNPPSAGAGARAGERSGYMAPPQSPGLFKRLFGSRLEPRPAYPAEPAPAPAPAPQAQKGRRVLFPPTAEPAAPTMEPEAPVAKAQPRPKKRKPKPVLAKKRSAPAPKVARTEAPESTPPAPEKAPAAAPDPLATPATPPTPAAPVATKKPRKGKTPPVVAETKPAESVPEASSGANEKLRFDEVKTKAATDPEVVELKAKADAAVTDEEARTAQRAYNTALFKKMREIDASLSDHINAMEAAILKRLDEK